MYLQQADELEAAGKWKEAERLYLTVKETDRAIAMYKRHNQYRDMLRLIRAYSPDLLDQTLLHLAEQLEKEGNLKQAEQYYMEVCVPTTHQPSQPPSYYRTSLMSITHTT